MKNNLLLPLALLLQTVLSATPAPDFTVTTSDGQTRQLYQHYVNQQKVLVLEIFFTTCPPCAAHAPHWQTLYQNMQAAHPGKVEFMLLSDKVADTDALVNAYLSSKGLTMPAAGSSGGSLAAVQPYKSGTFGLFYGTPTFVVIAPGSGEVSFNIQGNSPQETMALIAQQIEALLPPSQDCFLKSYFDNPVPDVQITVDAPAFDTTFMASGSYSVSLITELQGASYTIQPFKNDNPLSGVSTFDMIQITKHILGIEPLSQPWQLLAADANCSGSITTFDIIEIRKLVLGITAGFSGCGGASWRFVAEPDVPASSGSCIHFRGVKIGDVTGPYFAPDDPVDDRDRYRLQAENRRIERGKIYRVVLRAGFEQRLAGLQLSLGLDPAVLRIRSIGSNSLAGFGADHYNLELQRAEGYVPLSWSMADVPSGVQAGDALLTLEVEALDNALLSEVLHLDRHLTPESYGPDGTADTLSLDWMDVPARSTQAIRLTPNPARDVVYAVFESEMAGPVLLQLVDMFGTVVLEENFQAAAGANRAALRPAGPLAGLYLVKMNGRPAGKVVFGRKR